MSASTTAPPPVPISPATPLECLRYRYHHGCNLGSVYVTEKWITPNVFPPDATEQQTSELAAVTLSVNQFGLDVTRTKFEARWKGIVADADWDWLCTKAHCKLFNSVSSQELTYRKAPPSVFLSAITFLGPTFAQTPPSHPILKSISTPGQQSKPSLHEPVPVV